MPKPNSGSLRKNKNKITDLHPSMKGLVNIEDVEYWVSAWTNTGDDGEKYISLRFEKKDDKKAKSPQARLEDLGDDIPY
jgi:hypothetical protein